MTHWTEAVFRDRPEVFRRDLEGAVESAPEEVEQLLELLASEHDVDPASAFDVPCGIGRHAVALAERGLDVTGLDLSADYVERARERAEAAGVAGAGDATFRQGDMRELDVEGTFDLVLNVWTSFGYYDEETDRAILAALRERVAEDGALVMELANKEGILADFQDDGVMRGEDHVSFETREYDPETSRMHTEREQFEPVEDGYEHVGTMAYETRLFDPTTLRRWLLDAGFGSVALYADLTGEELTHESARLVVVAES